MIELKNVCKKYGDNVVFEDLNMQFETGKVNCIMGKSGVGKTTLIRLLMGIEQPTSGTVSGLENGAISAVFQEDRLCENLNVYTNILLPHLNKQSHKNLTKAKLDEMLENIGLINCGEKSVNTLSGGMKRRTAILRALLADYDTLILDEPFKGLDDNTKQNTIDMVKANAVGKTVIYITHDKAEAELMAPDRVIVL